MHIAEGSTVLALRGKHGQMRPELRNVGCHGQIVRKITDASGEYYEVEFYNDEYPSTDHVSRDCLEVINAA